MQFSPINIDAELESEIEICRQKWIKLTAQIKNFKDNNKFGEFQRIYSRLCHVSGQFNQIRGDVRQEQMACRHLFDELVHLNRQETDHCQEVFLIDFPNTEGSVTSLIDSCNLLLPEILGTSCNLNFNSTNNQQYYETAPHVVFTPKVRTI